MSAPQLYPFLSDPEPISQDSKPLGQSQQTSTGIGIGSSGYQYTRNGDGDGSGNGKGAVASTASHSASSQPTAGPGTGVEDQAPKLKTACTNCRQQKIKCRTTNDDLATPCERCSRMKLVCTYEARQSRAQPRWGRPRSPDHETPESAKRRLVARRDASTSNSSRVSGHPAVATVSPALNTPSSTMSRTAGPSPAVTAAPSTMSTAKDTKSTYQSPTQTLPREIDGLRLEPEVIDNLFGQFFKYYHPFLPILDPILRPNEYYAQSSFLFWSILAVASRRWPKDPTLMPSLRSHVLSHARKSIFSPTTGVTTITAILLLLSWSFPETQHYDEMPYVFSSALVHAAMRIGLNTPDRSQDFSRVKLNFSEEDHQRRYQAYVCCLVLYQRSSNTMGNNFGQFPTDTSLDTQKNMDSLSPTLHYQMKVQQIIADATRAFADNGFDLDTEPKIAVFDSISKQCLLELFQCHLRAPFNQIPNFASEPDIQLYMRMAALYITAFTFFKTPAEQYLTEWKAPFEAACSLVQHLNDLERKMHVDLYGTFYILHGTALAACTLLRCLKSPFADSLLESPDPANTSRSTAQALFFSALNIIRSMSIANNDKPMKSVWAMQELWRSDAVFKDPDDGSWNLDLRVRSRFASSLVYDTMWWGREVFSGMAGVFPKRSSSHAGGPPTPAWSNDLSLQNQPGCGNDWMVPNAGGADIFGPDLFGDMAFTQDWVLNGWEVAFNSPMVNQ